MKIKITLIIGKILKTLPYADRTKVNILDCLNRIKKIADKKDIELYKEKIEDMIKDEKILVQLKSGNEHLDKITKIFLLMHLREPKIGIQNFEDIKNHFESGLNEYRKMYSSGNTSDISDYMSLDEYLHDLNKITDKYSIEYIEAHDTHTMKYTLEESLKLFSIDKTVYEKFKNNVNDVLKSHTDDKLTTAKKRELLEKQIITFANNYHENEEKPKVNMRAKLTTDKKNRLCSH